MKKTIELIMGLAIGAGLTAGAVAQSPATPATPASAAAAPSAKEWQAPDINKLPDDKYGQMVRQGKTLMEETYKHIGPEVKDVSKRYAGNNLACVSCRMEAGARKFGTRGLALLSASRSTAGAKTRSPPPRSVSTAAWSAA